MFCKIILPSNEIHKLPSVPKTYEELNTIALKKFKGKIPEKFYFKYKDTDDELITLSNEEDFQTALLTSESDNVKTLRIFLIPEMGLPNNNFNYSVHNFSPASFANFQNDNSLDRVAKAKLSVSHACSHGYDKRAFDSSENFGDADLSRIGGQAPLVLERNKKSRSNPGEMEAQGQDEQFPDKHFSFERSAFLEGSNQLAGIPFNQDQLNTISELLDRKLKEKVEQKMQQIVVAELMGKLSEEYRNKSMKKNNPYTYTPYMGKSVVPSSGRASMKKQRTVTEGEDSICADCQKKIEEIKFTCLTCLNSEFCEACESKGEHPHPLLKTRLHKKNKPEGNEQQNTGPNSNKVQENDEKLSVANNKSQSIGNFGGYGGKRGLSPENKHFGSKGLKYSNSFAAMELPAQRNSENSFQAKNPSNFSRTQAHLSQSVIYGKALPTPGGTPFEKEIKKYKAAIVKPPIYDLINVKPGYIYNVEFTIKNTGNEDWPEDVKLICVNGIHKDIQESVPALAHNKSHLVKLELKAPLEPNIYLSQWRLQYMDEGVPKLFGSNLYIEINVKEGKKREEVVVEKKADNKEVKIEKAEKGEKGPVSQPKSVEKDPEQKELAKPNDAAIIEEQDKKNQVNQPESVVVDDSKKRSELSEEEQRLMRETNCSDEVLRFAQQLHSLAPHKSIESQIKYIQECPIHLDINDIAAWYLNNVDTVINNEVMPF